MRPRRSDQTLSRFAPAKVNLNLQVLGKRSDGFHDLNSLIAPLRWGDWLRWSPQPPSGDAPRLTLRLHSPASRGQSFTGIGVGEDNLVCRAARLVADAAGVAPHGRLELWKRVRPQAGLGGGSSDAAAALVLLNTAWGAGLSNPQLAGLASQLGSDVPFFLAESAAVCSGRGETVQPVDGVPALHLVVSQPSDGVPTPKAFAALSRQQNTIDAQQAERSTARLLRELRGGRLRAFADRVVNHLQDAAVGLVHSVGETLDRLAWSGCIGQWMTGSGSACVGLAWNAAHAKAVAGIMRADTNNTTFVTTTR